MNQRRERQERAISKFSRCGHIDMRTRAGGEGLADSCEHPEKGDYGEEFSDLKERSGRVEAQRKQSVILGSASWTQ